jgi:DUF4097 and DUF4098 domain-containing protein YvlB
VASVRETFETGRARLRVRNPAGDVQIEARDVEQTTVELVPLNDSAATRDALSKATVSAAGDEVVVEIDSGRNWSISIGNWGISSARVGVRITCPTGSELQCDTASADVRVDGTLGTTRVRTASGDIRLQRIEGQLEVKTASGDTQVEHVEGRATVQTVSGDADVRTAMSGLAVNSVSGDVTAGEVIGDLEVVTVSGDAVVRAAGPGEVAVKAVSGDVAVAMRRGLRVRLDVNSVSGKIGSELDITDAPARTDGPEAHLRVRTVSGDVRISRAAEAVA